MTIHTIFQRKNTIALITKKTFEINKLKKHLNKHFPTSKLQTYTISPNSIPSKSKLPHHPTPHSHTYTTAPYRTSRVPNLNVNSRRLPSRGPLESNLPAFNTRAHSPGGRPYRPSLISFVFGRESNNQSAFIWAGASRAAEAIGVFVAIDHQLRFQLGASGAA